ncbi:hypothetical protein Ptr902_03085 [Pyrenophora tritici-repentis]|nr:hypothetical protein Ptr902_03085 [Pyrenophora tritici-repentis]
MAPPPQPQSNQGDQQQQQHPPAYLTTILNNAYPTTTIPETIAPWPEAPAVTSASASTPPRSTHRVSTCYDTGGGSSSRPFDETRRGLQARGKNYNIGSGMSGAAIKGGMGIGGIVGSAKQYEERQRRDEAVAVLESEEMVMWIAASRNESIPQTRAHYRNIVFGLTQWEDANIAWHDEWDAPSGLREGSGGAGAEGQGASGSPARNAKGKEREITRMKKRVSLGQSQA